MMNILVLGGNGFIGKNIIEHYSKYSKNNDICFIVLFRHNIFIHESQILNIKYILCDVTNKNELEKIFIEFNISEVFHFLSTSVPANSNDNIVRDINDNLINTIYLLDLMKKNNVNKIIYLSSGGSVYGDEIEHTYQENMTLLPNNAYGITKLTIEKYIHLYHRLYGIQYIILRLSNLYGEYHISDFNGVINITLRKAIQKNVISIWGNGNTRKDFLYIKDFSLIFWKLYYLENLNYIVNVGSGITYSINDILDNIKNIIPNILYEYINPKNFDTKNIYFKTNLLDSLISKVHTPISDGIKATYLWELNSYKNTNLNQEHGI